MANLYNLEPQPTAKVVLNTTSGDIQIELFAKQCPLASRNFLQHCLDGYYNNTIFHRLVPGFIVQGGDPTGTGSGGISAINDGEPFQDEFHSRLKFNRRGLLGMANEGPNTNASQFFLTLDQTPELQGKNTMFGRVEGDTIYNLMKMADAELVGLEEGNERPLYPTKVTGAEILVNPFEDMIARATEAPRSTDVGGRKEVKKRKKPAGKNTLSFGGEDGEEEAAPVLKKVKANPKLVVVEEEPAPKPAPKPRREKPVQENPPREELKAEVKIAKPPSRVEEPISEDEEEESEDEREKRRRRVLENTNAEIAALKASMKRTNDAKSHEKEKPKSALEAMIPTTSIRGRKRGKASDEHGAMDIFKAFQSRLAELPAMKESDSKEPDQGVDPTTGAADEPADDEAELCDLHFIANCLSCKAWDGEQPDGEVEEDEDETSWMAHSLSFAKDTKARQDDWKTKMDQYEVIDPREKARELEEKRKKEKGSNGDRSRMKR